MQSDGRNSRWIRHATPRAMIYPGRCANCTKHVSRQRRIRSATWNHAIPMMAIYAYITIYAHSKMYLKRQHIGQLTFSARERFVGKTWLLMNPKLTPSFERARSRFSLGYPRMNRRAHLLDQHFTKYEKPDLGSLALFTGWERCCFPLDTHFKIKKLQHNSEKTLKNNRDYFFDPKNDPNAGTHSERSADSAFNFDLSAPILHQVCAN